VVFAPVAHHLRAALPHRRAPPPRPAGPPWAPARPSGPAPETLAMCVSSAARCACGRAPRRGAGAEAGL